MAANAGRRRIDGERQPVATGQEEEFREFPLSGVALQCVVESVTDGLLVVDRDWRYTYVNGAAAAFLRSTADELLGATIWETLPQSRYPRFCEEITRAAGERIPLQFEEYFEPPGRWYECRCYPSAGGLAIILMDATEHKQVEEVLLESRQVMELAIAGSNAGVWRIDLDPNKPGVIPDYVYLSPQLKALIGFGEDEFPNSRSAWQRRIPPEDVQRIEQAARAHVEGRSDLFQVDFRIRHKDGSLCWFSSRGRLCRDEYHRPIRWVGIDWDITERKRAEEELARAKREWERTFDAVPDLIAVIDPEHKITRVNRAMAERLGGQCGDIVESRCFACVHGQDEPVTSCPHIQALADGREHTAEVYEERLGGYFLVTCTPLFDPDGRPIGTVHVSRDITEQKRMQADLRRLNDQLEEEVQARTRELKEAVDSLEREQVRRLAGVFHDDLLYQSDLKEAFTRLAEQVQARHGLIVRVTTRGPVDLHSDALKAFLYQAGEELLFNVAKYARTDQARIGLRRFRRYVGLSVSHQGRGFDPQAPGKTTGFGLVSIRERVEQLGGRMRIISAKGRGCTLRIVLPDDAVESAPRDCPPSGRRRA